MQKMKDGVSFILCNLFTCHNNCLNVRKHSYLEHNKLKKKTAAAVTCCGNIKVIFL